MSEELAWAAGLFDGEGCVVPLGSGTIMARLSMADSESVYRFHRAIGSGRVWTMHRREHHHRPLETWEATGRTAILAMETLRPWLSSVKIADYGYALDRAPNAGKGAGWREKRTSCAKGHLYTPETKIRAKGARECAACRREWERRRTLKRRGQGAAA
jgi:hypothetical protein